MENKTTFIVIALMTLASVLMGQDRPNIVFIFADDFGRSDISSYHLQTRGVPGGAPTPNIEALIDEGMWFTDAHSPAAVCAPSRYAVMTGNYNIRSSRPGGIWGHFDDNTMTDSDITIGQAVKREGYHTGFIGKWHFGGDYYELNSNNIYRGKEINALGQVDFNTWVSNNPNDLGFDYDFTLPHGIQGPSYLAYENGQWYPLGANSDIIHLDETNIDPLQLSAKGEGPGDSNWNAYDMNEILANKAVNFINNASQQPEPFFLYYSATSVHIPHTAPDFIEGEAYAGTTPDPLTDMIRVFDWEVKKIVDALKANGEYENTVIVFTSDNGGLNYAKDVGHYSSGNLRGDKRDPYEGGHRIPLIVTWPCVVPAGSTSDHMVTGTDFVATFAGIAGGAITSNEAKDSHNFLQLLLGDNSYEPRNEIINQGASGPRTATIRDGDWKLIFECNADLDADFNPTYLFDLSTNLSENDSGNYINDPAYTTRKDDMMNRFIEVRTSTTRSVPVNPASYTPPADPCDDTDSDGDGINDSVDICPTLHNDLIGTSCDDGSDCTINDVYTTNCVCEGTSTSVEDASLAAAADAFVRGGSYENNNYGTGGLATKKTSNLKYTRQSYIKFDLTGYDATDFASATLQLTVTNNSSGTVSQALSHLSDDSWTESGITWSNQPGSSSLITNFDVSNAVSTASVDISADVLSALNGDKTISLLLEGTGTEYVIYGSRESGQGPILTLTYNDCEPTPCPDSDNDGICDADDETNGDCTLGASCDDGDACTIGDAYDANCNCVGTFQDSDNDGICDANDDTNGNCTLNASCDDGDPCTVGETYDANCNCGGGTPVGGNASTDVLNPTDDTFIRGGTYADNNYGNSTTIHIKKGGSDKYTRYGYLKFDVSGVDAAQLQSATFRIKVSSNSNGSVAQELLLAPSDNWTESGLTWNNNQFGGTSLSNFTAVAAGQWAEIDITSAVQGEAAGDGTVSLAIISDNNKYIRYHTKESSGNAPELVLTYGGACNKISQSDESAIKIYPNPSDDRISIEMSDNLQEEIEQIAIYSITGELLMVKTDGFMEPIYIGDLPSGIYVVQARGAGKIWSERLIKK